MKFSGFLDMRKDLRFHQVVEKNLTQNHPTLQGLQFRLQFPESSFLKFIPNHYLKEKWRMLKFTLNLSKILLILLKNL
jgi:hypothetical protein